MGNVINYKVQNGKQEYKTVYQVSPREMVIIFI